MGELGKLFGWVLVLLMCFPDGSDGSVYLMHPKYELNMEGKGLTRLETFVDRDRSRRRKILSQEEAPASTSAIFPIRGNVYPDGLYYVSVHVGNPAKPYFLDVDTGSDLTWLQCDAPCVSCAKGPHPLYKPRKGVLVSCKDPLCAVVQAGHSYECADASDQCDYEIEYADHSSSGGVLVKDSFRVWLTNKTLLQTQSVFGCAYDQQGSLAKSPAATDGVLGLSGGKASLPSQWAKEGLIKNVIGHCMNGGGREGGYMFFGNDLVPTRGMTWVPMIGKPSMKHYYVGTASMNLGSKPLNSGGRRNLGGIIFDSGSSFTYLTHEAYSTFLSAVKENISGKQLKEDSSDLTLPVCWRGQKRFRSVADANQYFKPLTLEFSSSASNMKSKQLEISPEGYLIISSKGNVCLGILDGNAVGDGTYNIIGDISFQGYLVVYDNDDMQIGWASTDCRKPPNSVMQGRPSYFSHPLSEHFVAIEDSELHGNSVEETNACGQELGQAVCPSSLYFFPGHGGI